MSYVMIAAAVVSAGLQIGGKLGKNKDAQTAGGLVGMLGAAYGGMSGMGGGTGGSGGMGADPSKLLGPLTQVLGGGSNRQPSGLPGLEGLVVGGNSSAAMSPLQPAQPPPMSAQPQMQIQQNRDRLQQLLSDLMARQGQGGQWTG